MRTLSSQALREAVTAKATSDAAFAAELRADPQKAIELANKADRMIFEEGFSLPLVQSAGAVATRENLANFGAFGLASADYTKVGFLK